MAPVVQPPNAPHPWTLPFSKHDLYTYLHDRIGIAPAALVRLTSTSQSFDNLPDTAEDIGDLFLEAFALPESRLQFCAATEILYAQLTNWVTRADLLRVLYPHFPTPKEAQEAAAQLAASGIVGVQDVARRGIPPALTQEATLAGTLPFLEAARKTAVQTPASIIATTQAVLVVKGAGGQTQDSTLAGFLKGFWSAVATTASDATLIEQIPTHPSQKGTDNGRTAEIRVGEQRLWIKESYWEPRIEAVGSMSTLRLEWRMATYVLGHVLWEMLSSPTRSERRHSDSRRKFWHYWGAFLCAYLLVFIPIALTWWQIIVEQIRTVIAALNATGNVTLAPFLGLSPSVFIWLGVIGLALVTSILPALDTTLILRATDGSIDKQSARIERLPAVASWLLVPLIGGFLLQPVLYLLFLGMLAVMQGVLIGLRKLAWAYRRLPESDTSFAEWTQGEKGVEKTSTGRWIDRFILSPWLYRYLVVVALPIIAMLLLLAKFLRAIPGLAGLGRAIENLAASTVSGGLGDVVVYANEPAQAAWIRGALVADIHHFHTRTEVESVHVFAHSQGTPISFETLFYHLPSALRRKVKTYITIGSVLNYFNQVNWVLDLYFVQRFPRRPYPHAEFAKEFQWINFWNHTDPVPEFSALDVYEDYLTSPTLERNPASPTNIRTRGTLLPWTSHSEYWSNVTQVQTLFAERLLFGTRIDGAAANGPLRTGSVSHAFILRWWLPVALLVIVGFSILIQSPTVGWLFTYNVPLWVIGEAVQVVTFVLQGITGGDTTLVGEQFLMRIAWAIAAFGFVNWLRHLFATIQRYAHRDA